MQYWCNYIIFTLQIRSNIHALHVDVKEGQTEAIIRFDTPKSAEEVIIIYWILFGDY